MNIFIDAGANNGCSVRKFRSLYDKDEQYYVYSFEIEPNFFNCFEGIPNLSLIKKAVWIEDGECLFYRDICNNTRAGGSLIREKISSILDFENPLKVETIDFSKWIKDTFSEKDNIILKMDIEGAEYKVISKMLAGGSFEYIKKLFIEWHYKKIGLSEKEHLNLVRKISIPILPWDAL